MFTWASILSGFVRLANRIAEYMKIQKAERTGEERQELRSRRAQDEQVEQSRDAWDAAERDFDKRLSDDPNVSNR